MTRPESETRDYYCYVCEAGGIQSYLLSSGRLRDIVGGSETLEMLWNDLCEETVAAADLQNEIQFARRSGGAFYALSTQREVLDTFQSLFSLAAAQFAPGLSLEAGRGRGATPYQSYEAAMRDAKASRSARSADLPVAGPFVRRDPRTGLPAASELRLPGGREDVDLPTLRFSFAQRGAALHGRSQRKTLTGKFSGDGDISWPVNLSPDEGSSAEGAFPFSGEKRTIGLVYIDGSGMASVSKVVREHIRTLESGGKLDAFVRVFGQFSQAITEATERAAFDATQAVLLPNSDRIVPARPIVLGGDDLSIIVRADLALDFARHYLRAFERTSEKALRQIGQDFDIKNLPRRLTAAAGIVYARSSQPYFRLHALAEEVGDYAKRVAKRWMKTRERQEVPSVIAWHRVTTALFGDYGDILEQELTARSGEPVRLSLVAYSIDRLDGLPCLDDLMSLVAQLSPDLEASRGPMRGLVTALSRDDADARRRYRRWREVQTKANPAAVREFDNLLRKLVGELDPDVDLPCGRSLGEFRLSPLADVMALLSAGRPEPKAEAVEGAST